MKTHTGFTLIEVLIAMLVIAVGLLGLAALQTYTLRSNLAAYNHGQATQLLYDMSDRMRASGRTVDDKGTSIISTIIQNYVIADSSTDPRTKDVKVTDSHPCRTVGTTCTAAKMIEYDLIEWNNAIVATLPMGRGCITSANGVFNLYITWDDNRDDNVTTDVTLPDGCTFSTYKAPSSGTYHDPIFTMSLQL